MRVAQLLLATCSLSLASVAPHGPCTPTLRSIPQGRPRLPSPSTIVNAAKQVQVLRQDFSSIPVVGAMRADADDAHGSEGDEFELGAYGPGAGDTAPKSLGLCLSRMEMSHPKHLRLRGGGKKKVCIWEFMHACPHISTMDCNRACSCMCGNMYGCMYMQR